MRNNLFVRVTGLCLLTWMIASGCGPRRITQSQKQNNTPTTDQLIETNRRLLQKEMKNLKEFIGQHNWNLQTTGSGLYYYIYPQQKNVAQGKIIVDGDRVTICYTIRSLKGEVLESSSQQGPRQVVVGHEEMEAGLYEALLKMHDGDSARLLLLPHLAFGFTGDGIRIPRQTTLWYEIKVQIINQKHN